MSGFKCERVFHRLILDDGTRRWDGVPVPLERQCLDALLAGNIRSASPSFETAPRRLTDRQVQYLMTHLKAHSTLDRPTAFLIWRSLFAESSTEILDLAGFTHDQSLSQAIYEHIAGLPVKSIQCRSLFLSDEVRRGSGSHRWRWPLKFRAFLRRFQSLHTITVSNDLIDGVLGDIGQFCPALRQLRIYQASRVAHALAMDDDDMLDFIGYQVGNKHFQHLDLSSCPSGFSAESLLALHQLPNLSTLDTLTDHFQTVETREIKPFNSLQSLNLRAHQSVKACLSVIPQLCPNLLHLSLRRINGDSISSDNCQPQYAHYLPELRALGPRLKRCQVMLCSDVNFLAEHAPNLETLHLVDPKLRFCLKAGQFRQLNHLELFKHSFSLDFDIVRQILETCAHLTSALFYASELKNITHDLVLQTFQSGKNPHIRRNLRSFRLASVHSVMRDLTWDTVIGIVTACPKLELLDDLSTWAVTRDGRGQKTSISGRTFHLVQDNHASNCDQSLTALLWMTENYKDILHP